MEPGVGLARQYRDFIVDKVSYRKRSAEIKKIILNANDLQL